MGTRSNTTFFSEWSNEKPLAMIYRQFDGYPEGHGVQLARFLKEIKLVNGLRIDSEYSEVKVANKMSCLAAQVVVYLKEKPGDIYLESPEDEENLGTEYNYRIYRDKMGVTDKESVLIDLIESTEVGYQRVFYGSPEEFIKKYER